MAMLTLLETLAPEERAAFLLHDVFDVDYDRIAGILGRNEAACRQMIHRARQRVRGDRKRFESSLSDKLAMLEKFKSAVEASDEATLFALLAPDAVWTADGGGKTAASPRPLVGSETIVKLLLGLRRIWPAHRTMELSVVNGEPGLIFREHGHAMAVVAFDMAEGRITSVYAVVNPDKLPQQ